MCLFFLVVSVGLAMCQSWAVGALCWGVGRLSFFLFGTQGAASAREHTLCSRPTKSLTVSPLLLSWCFCSVFLKLSWQVCWLFYCTSCASMSPSYFSSLYHSVLFHGLFPHSHLILLRISLEYNSCVFNFNNHILISRESMWLFYKIHLLFSFNCSFIMDTNSSFFNSILLYRLFQIEIISTDLVLFLLSVMSVECSL